MKLDRAETVFLLGAALLCCVAVASAKAVQKREISPEMLFQEKEKRPFCNAFTGCGRKRSDASLLEEAGLAGGGATAAEQEAVRMWAGLLASVQDARDRQMAPAYYRGRRSAAESRILSSESETKERTQKR